MKKNSGLITDHHTVLNKSVYRQYLQGKTSLVAQGGGQRGAFTAGVLDAFLLAHFDPFSEFYGASAGSLNLLAFLCRQYHIGHSFITELTTAPEFFNLFDFVRHRQPLGLSWALEQIQTAPYNLNLDVGRSALGQRKAYSAVTDQDSLQDHYLPMLSKDWLKTMLATCAIPKISAGSVQIGEYNYIDGGVSAAIPVQEAWRRGGRNILVIRTEPASELEVSHPPYPNESTSNASLSNGSKLASFISNFTLSQQISSARPFVHAATYRHKLGSHLSWDNKFNHWKSEWADYIQKKQLQMNLDKALKRPLIDGSRWLSGAENLYRLSHLIGEDFDLGLADLLAIHYQTNELTQTFLATPPDDTFILQIAPSEELKSTSLLSSKADLQFDYQLGVKAGMNTVHLYDELVLSTNMSNH